MKDHDRQRSACDTASHFFVDEAGDLTLVGRRGRNIIGTDGVSKTFMVGVAQISDPERVVHEMEGLRQELLNDPYLSSIPSMQAVARKTARSFHAKDDCTEVRMAVFKLLARHDIKIFVGIRRKQALAELVRTTHAGRMKLDADSVYDDMVKSIFKRVLHKADRNTVYFARRGKSSRQVALERAIKRAQDNFSRDTGIPSDKPTQVISAVPSDAAGLQVIDYFLWALQRFYERGEDRYFAFLAGHYRLIMDFDDRRNGKAYGTWYSAKEPLTKEKMLPITG